MIAHDFVYARPDGAREAVALYRDFAAKGCNPVYYGGGSEVITMCRSGGIAPGAVVDLKGIPEANVLGVREDALVIGGCVSLRAIKDSRLFPLLGEIAGRIADHTNQCRITLGGNLCGSIIYRETAQALLLTDADVLLCGPDGLRTASIHAVFCERMRLRPGEFVLQVHVPARLLDAPYNHLKKTASEKIDYPLLSMATMLVQGQVRIAMSGLYPYPFRSAALEEAFNGGLRAGKKGAERMLAALPGVPLRDAHGSAEYRLFVLRQSLSAMMEVWAR